MIVERDVREVLDAVAGIQPVEPVFAVCITYTQGEDLEVPGLQIGLESDRARILRGDPGEFGWVSVWNPSAYATEDVQLANLSSQDPEFAAAQEVVLEALEGVVLEPVRWVLSRVARELPAARMPFVVTDDFVTFVLDASFHEADIIEQLRFVAPADVFARLRERGAV